LWTEAEPCRVTEGCDGVEEWTDVNGDNCMQGGCERCIGGVVDSTVKDDDAWDEAVLACLAANAVDRF